MKYTVAVPAYGRDYKSKAAVMKDWNAGKDFIINCFHDPYDGKPINKEDAESAGVKVELRYAKLTKLVMVG